MKNHEGLFHAALRAIAAYKTSAPHRPGQIKAEHREMINKARIALVEAARTPSPSGAREAIEQVISAWAFAYGIDGAARNDLFKRLAALRSQGRGEGE